MVNNKPTQDWGIGSPSKTHNAIAELMAAHNSPDEVIKSITDKYGIEKTTPDMIPDSIRQIYETQANEQLNPWYANEQTKGTAKIGNEVGQTQTDYQNTIDQLNQGLQSDTQKLNANEASSGTWASGARAERANSLANMYNNKYKTAYDTASGNLQNYGLANESNYGVQMPSSNITQYQANNGVGTATSNVAKYNPFGIKNTLDTNRSYAANTLGTDYLQARIKNPNYNIAK